MVEVPSSLPPRTKPSRLYLGSPEKFIEIDDWDVFRKKTIPELQAAGWNAVRMEGQELTHPVPPPQPQDDPVRYYFLGIVGTMPWPRARPKHHIHKFQKPLKPRSGEENADSKIWSYFHPEGWQLGDPEIGSKDYDEAHRALSEFMPRYGLFRKGLYADNGYESFVGDDRGSGMLKVSTRLSRMQSNPSSRAFTTSFPTKFDVTMVASSRITGFSCIAGPSARSTRSHRAMSSIFVKTG
jgi:hypothetical protein